MEQMKSDGLETVDINFEDATLPETVRRLRPMVWHDESAFCVLLGPDTQAGVFGCGETIRNALADWDAQVREVLKSAKPADEVARYIKDSMEASVYKIN
jgi:hypothetical protein